MTTGEQGVVPKTGSLIMFVFTEELGFFPPSIRLGLVGLAGCPRLGGPQPGQAIWSM